MQRKIYSRRELLDEFLNKHIPNTFTQTMGERIRDARQEKGWSQQDLAEAAYRRRASISDMENGKMVVDSETLSMMALVLDKPIAYFFPRKFSKWLFPGDLTPDEQELITEYRRLNNTELRRTALKQLRVMAEVHEGSDGKDEEDKLY